MCGIVGYTGKREALPILIGGIRCLEYRGYDSSGIAIIGDGKVNSVKSVGKINELENKLRDKNINGKLGIVHSRWATHGDATEKNAHPHHDCSKSIWIAHNGIIENYKELKSYLNNRGHKFISETDTEVLAHLIEDIKNDLNLSFSQAIPRALNMVDGAYGIVAVDLDEPDTLIAARNFSPLLIGIGDEEYFVASDASAILTHTRKVIYLHDGEYAILKPSGYDIFTLDSRPITPKINELDWDVEIAGKDGFESFMFKEIMSQSDTVLESIKGRVLIDNGKAKLGGLDDVAQKLRNITNLHIVGCGTTYLAGKIGEYMIEEYAQIPVRVESGSEFRYKKPIFEKNDAFLAISQSGETADTISAIHEANDKGVLTLGIVNAVGSTIARETDAGIYQHIGPEIGVASTKAFTSQISILALLTVFLGRQRSMSLTMGNRILSELGKMPNLIKKFFKQNENIIKIVDKYRKYNNFLYLGRKYNFPIACEGALKLKEISYVHAEGISAGEMKHGPIAMIDENFPSIFIAPKDSVYKKNISSIQEIKARKGNVLAIATEGDKDISKIVDDVIYIPKTLEMLTPILSVIPLQLFAYYFAKNKGLDIDKPRNLAKSVTVE